MHLCIVVFYKFVSIHCSNLKYKISYNTMKINLRHNKILILCSTILTLASCNGSSEKKATSGYSSYLSQAYRYLTKPEFIPKKPKFYASIPNVNNCKYPVCKINNSSALFPMGTFFGMRQEPYTPLNRNRIENYIQTPPDKSFEFEVLDISRREYREYRAIMKRNKDVSQRRFNDNIKKYNKQTWLSYIRDSVSSVAGITRFAADALHKSVDILNLTEDAVTYCVGGIIFKIENYADINCEKLEDIIKDTVKAYISYYKMNISSYEAVLRTLEFTGNAAALGLDIAGISVDAYNYAVGIFGRNTSDNKTDRIIPPKGWVGVEKQDALDAIKECLIQQQNNEDWKNGDWY